MGITGMEVGCAGFVRGGPTHVAGYKHTLGHAPEEELGATSAMQVLCLFSEWVKWGSESDSINFGPGFSQVVRGAFMGDEKRITVLSRRRSTMRTTCLRALDIGLP
jgi:hypothetical protein